MEGILTKYIDFDTAAKQTDIEAKQLEYAIEKGHLTAYAKIPYLSAPYSGTDADIFDYTPQVQALFSETLDTHCRLGRPIAWENGKAKTCTIRLKNAVGETPTIDESWAGAVTYNDGELTLRGVFLCFDRADILFDRVALRHYQDAWRKAKQGEEVTALIAAAWPEIEAIYAPTVGKRTLESKKKAALAEYEKKAGEWQYIEARDLADSGIYGGGNQKRDFSSKLLQKIVQRAGYPAPNALKLYEKRPQ